MTNDFAKTSRAILARQSSHRLPSRPVVAGQMFCTGVGGGSGALRSDADGSDHVDNLCFVLRPTAEVGESMPLPLSACIAELLQHVAILRALLAEHRTSVP